ncbi:response regulator transcription factor [Pseudorhodoferax sp.]|uniref:response regulator transcription factor n=1 Tax=Pseudorhodoferax sp. TaxID=1993553 RepID=UPI002DD61E36|nr:response regulator transcription factor [Pseudorhodoferax sp.]
MAETLPHIAVVDDEPDLRRAVAAYLARRGCRVTDLADGAALRALLAHEMVDVVVLDINMPGEDGLSVARWLRTQPLAIGIVMLTGNDDLADRVVGLELGADDYVTKPFEPRELLARVRALLRRLGRSEGVAPAPADTLVRVGRARFDRRTGQATDAQGRPLPLTRNERQVLALLVQQPQQPVSRELLLQAMREEPLEAYDRAVDSCIARLRKKIEPDPARPATIRTLHGQGYVFTPAAEG